MPRTKRRPTVVQPLLNFIARRNARARELAAAMQMPCVACRRSLASHIGTGNKWKGCAR